MRWFDAASWRWIGLVGLAACLGCDRSSTSVQLEPAAPRISIQDQDCSIESPIVAGSREDFMLVRHVRLEGSHASIGQDLAKLAQERHGWEVANSGSPAKTQAQRAYFEKYWPQQLARMEGIATTAEQSLTDSKFIFSSLGYQEIQGGCTCFYLPPEFTNTRGGLFSRNFDFSTGPFNRQPRTATNPDACSRPYVMELYPEKGYATLAICCFDLLGVVDGINSEGLTVALLADDEIMNSGGYHPAPGIRPGFNVVELPRYLLETCATVEEARQKLYESKLYYTRIPCHYLIADAQGNSMVWENRAGMNDGIAVDGKGQPQITTNFMLHLHEDTDNLPQESHRSGSFNRYRKIAALVKKNGSSDLQDVCRYSNKVAAISPTSAGVPPGRTLWHSVYDLAQRKLSVSFYLGETGKPADSSGTVDVRRTPYLEFQLNADRGE